MSFIPLILILLYFFTGTHQKVLDYLGLSRRDDTLLFIGYFIYAGFRALGVLITAIGSGVGIAGAIIVLGLYLFVIYYLYQKL
jgi:hypothetical protein